MGVHGLWRLVQPSGKPVPLETLENKVLAVDISIWLHQAVKGFQDSRGAPVANAHLLGLYHRICKLLYFRVKPVFVFDGGVPVLKKETIAKRNQSKHRRLNEAERIHKSLLSTLLKHTAVSKVLSEKTKAALITSSPPKKSTRDDDDLYLLPPSQLEIPSSPQQGEEETSSSDDDPGDTKHYDLHSVDTESAEFKALPSDVRHEILTDLIETRKQSSWGRIHELPTQSDDFSGYQMKRLLKRNAVQVALEAVEKEMGGHSLSLGELEKLLKDQGVITNNAVGNRIASDENTRFLLIKNLKQAVEDARRLADTVPEEIEDTSCAASTEENTKNKGDEEFENTKNKADEEFENDLQTAIALSLQDKPSTSGEPRKTSKRLPLSFLSNYDEYFTDSSDEEVTYTPQILTSAASYMLEYSGLTPSEIAKILANKSGKQKVETLIENVEEKKKLDEVEDKNEESNTKHINDEAEDKNEESNTKHINDLKSAETTEKEGQREEENLEMTEVDCETSDLSTIDDSNSEVQTKNNIAKGEEHEASISASDSDDSDLMEVEEVSENKMEVVIDPNESIQDDMFKDVFENEGQKDIEKKMESSQESTSSEKTVKVILNVNQKATEDDLKDVVEVPEKESNSKDEEKQSPETVSLKETIGEIIKDYTTTNDGKKDNRVVQQLTVKDMEEMKNNLRKEETELAIAMSSKERMASNITDQMYHEAQELLELFGIPFVVAPMEAEAQCAYLEEINLTNGTITDDSDIWLFGGKTVYKNFFQHGRQVMEFTSEDILRVFKLSREQMILLAMLVGSDYTIGLQGVGPVTALEILAAFPPLPSRTLSGLSEFRVWFTKGKVSAPGRTGLKSKLKNVTLTEGFPNYQILQAYLEPPVDKSSEPFSWAKPNILGLVEFARRKFGWTRKKSEEILAPVLKRLDETRQQKSIRDYFKTVHKVDSRVTEEGMSKRVQTALNRIGKNLNGEKIDEDDPEPTKRKSKRKSPKEPKQKKKRVTKNQTENGVEQLTPEDVAAGTSAANDDDLEVLKSTLINSKNKAEEIEKEAKTELKQKIKSTILPNLHRKEVIPQKQRDKSDMLRNKLKAIETFRKSKLGNVKKRGNKVRVAKEDASYLSENSDSN